jgi:predicted AAA+ superfamily ATPase
MTERAALLKSVRDDLRVGSVVALLPPHQCGKTKLARHFISTFLERDPHQLGMRLLVAPMRRFWMMPAQYGGGIWNGSQIGRSPGDAPTTVRRLLDAFTWVLVVRVLQPPYRDPYIQRQKFHPCLFLT